MTLTDSAAPVLDHCVFQNNSNMGNGGAIRASGLLSDLNLVNCTFSQNTANPSQAVGNYVGGALYLPSGNANILNSVFAGNRANSRCSGACFVTGRGGAIWLGDGNVTLQNNELTRNQADAFHQGGCQNGFGGSYSYGGALYVDAGVVSLVNNIMACNMTTATDCPRGLNGAGLYVNGGAVEVTNATIARNSSTGLYRAGGTLDVKNSIVFFNNGNGSQIGGDVTVTYSDVQNGYPGDRNILFNPAFAGPACDPGAFELLAGSPAIDAGDNRAVPVDTLDVDANCDRIEQLPTDLAGRPRFADDLLTIDTGVGTAPVVDMGAYEYADCNGNFVGDHSEIEEGTSPDCNGNGIPDACDISLGISGDVNGDDVPNECQGIITIVRSDPPDGAIDARQPEDAIGGDPKGWNELTIVFNGDPSGTTLDEFTLVEQGMDDVPPGLVSVETVCGHVVSLQFSKPIEAGAWTILTYEPTGASIRLGYLPGDVNGDRTSAPVDILEIIDDLNGVRVPPLVMYQCDIDRSNLCTPADILSEIDLLNGASGFAVWNGVSLPLLP